MKFLLIAAFTIFSSQAFGQTALETLTKKIDTFLKAHVSATGGVDYVSIDKNFKGLESLVNEHKTAVNVRDLAKFSEDEKLATYINLYNIGMIYNLLKYAKAENINLATRNFFRKIEVNEIKVPGGDIWGGNYKVPLGNLMVNLNDIEHKLIRGKKAGALASYKVKKLDPRIHAAVNCAAVSCPKLGNEAYTPAKVQAQLDASMTSFLSSSSQIMKKSQTAMKANKILNWYYSDFDDHGKAIGLKGAGDYLAKFVSANAADSKWKQTHFKNNFNNRSKAGFFFSSDFDFFYDWHPNDIRNRK